MPGNWDATRVGLGMAAHGPDAVMVVTRALWPQLARRWPVPLRPMPGPPYSCTARCRQASNKYPEPEVSHDDGTHRGNLAGRTAGGRVREFPTGDQSQGRTVCHYAIPAPGADMRGSGR